MTTELNAHDLDLSEPEIPHMGDGPPLRIGVITFAFAPVLSGIASGAQCRVRRLLERGHEVLLMHPDVAAGYDDSIPVRNMAGLAEFEGNPHFQSFAYPTRPLKFRKSHPEPMSYRHWSIVDPLKAFDADVVIVEEPVGMRGTISFGLGGYRRPVGPEYIAATGRPVIGILHTDWLGFAERNIGHTVTNLVLTIARPVLANACRQFTRMVAPSHYLTEKFNAVGDFNIEYLSCHGIDCSEFRPENIVRDPLPDVAGPVLVNSGRIVAEKSIPVLLDAFGVIVESIPNARLYILGEGEDRQSLMRDAQRRYGDRVQFPGQFSGEELAAWYARADVYVVASEAENFCSANLEALASGTPVVAAAAGGNVEQVEDGTNGFLFEPGNHKQLAERVVRILQDDTLHEAMSRAARHTALEYDYNLCTDRLLELVQKLVADSRQTVAVAAT